MKKYTKLGLATLCFIVSTSVLADGYKGEAPPLVPVSIPMFNGGFEFTLGAIYMNPDSSNLNYLGVQETRSSTNSITNRVDYAVDPDYGWGFLLGLGYVIPGTANDVKLDWMYFHNDFSSDEYILGAPSSTIAVLFPTDDASLSSTEALNASGTVDYKFDAIDLTFGQYLNFGSRLQTRLFTGLRYMRLDDDLSTSYATSAIRGESPSTPISETSWTGEINSSFNGLGPLVGFKADYYLGAGFSLSGGIDGTLLVGQLSLDASNYSAVLTQATSTSPWILSSIDSNSFDWDDQNVVALGYDAKFGFDYKYQFNNGTLLGVELGYQVTKYLDVVEEIDRDTSTPQRFDTDVTNFRLAGPYLTVNVKV